jgi:hypothetical protein
MSCVILTVPKSGGRYGRRVWVETPQEAYEQIVDMLECGYTFDEMEWEVL